MDVIQIYGMFLYQLFTPAYFLLKHSSVASSDFMRKETRSSPLAPKLYCMAIGECFKWYSAQVCGLNTKFSWMFQKNVSNQLVH